MKDFLRKHGWTQKGLALSIGIDPSTVHHWTTGESIPSAASMFRVAELLEVPFREVYEALGYDCSKIPRDRGLPRDVQQLIDQLCDRAKSEAVRCYYESSDVDTR